MSKKKYTILISPVNLLGSKNQSSCNLPTNIWGGRLYRNRPPRQIQKGNGMVRVQSRFEFLVRDSNQGSTLSTLLRSQYQRKLQKTNN